MEDWYKLLAHKCVVGTPGLQNVFVFSELYTHQLLWNLTIKLLKDRAAETSRMQKQWDLGLDMLLGGAYEWLVSLSPSALLQGVGNILVVEPLSAMQQGSLPYVEPSAQAASPFCGSGKPAQGQGQGLAGCVFRVGCHALFIQWAGSDTYFPCCKSVIVRQEC